MIKRVSYFFALVTCLWGLGLIIFLRFILIQPHCWDSTADAIIILTGGHGRLEKGFKLIQKTKRPHVFVSGVDPRVHLNYLLKLYHLPPELSQYIDVDNAALNTQDNARQSAYWAKNKGHNRIILVTSYYHIPRSLIEFKRFAPSLKIIPYPTFPKQFSPLALLKNPAEWKTIIEEYHKYCIARCRHHFRRTLSF